MDLNRRVTKLEMSAGAKLPPEPVHSEEDLAVMQRIVERTYADPARYASRIAIFEQAQAAAEAAERGEAQAGR